MASYISSPIFHFFRLQGYIFVIINTYQLVKCNLNENVNKLHQVTGYVSGYTIFNIGGNNYRVIALVYYPVGKVYIRYVFTHREYDDWCKQHRQEKG
ncbi:MAG: type II toxin-antitoxin system HigB family toxin [Pseudomonadota bacterium]|nr:type II toxin-antitoxin system HigB family toxin [Pseudomonadota bacterium]